MAMNARLVGIQPVAERTAAFTFELVGAAFEFKAGQSCDVTLLTPKYEDAQGSTRAFSIASSPADLPRVMFATRLTGSAFKRSLAEAAMGTEVEIDGPFGSFTLHQNVKRSAFFLAGGIGITPFHAMIKDAVERSLPHRLGLFYSNRTAAGTAFLKDFEAWAGMAASFQFWPTLTQPEAGETWPYETGPLDLAFLTRHLVDAAGTIFYLAGPARFVKAMQETLPAAGADPDNIRAEEFAGY
jgi:ferredoxin-NADP reductase